MRIDRCSVRRRGRGVVLLLTTGMCLSCAPASEDDETVPGNPNAMIRLLASGQPVFGIFSGDHTAEQGALMAQNRETDFVFYSLESGPFDLPTMGEYMRALADSAPAAGPHPLALRIPPIRDDREAARDRVAQALAAGVDAVVFPHVESTEEASLAVAAMGTEVWPANPQGRLINMLIVEDRIGVEHAREIVETPGVSVVFAGPGDLRRAYDRDMEAVEQAIQTVLAACVEFDVPCGITAGADDIAERLSQGFRMIIVTEPEALAVGLAASGRRS